jgi:hypothetical protein
MAFEGRRERSNSGNKATLGRKHAQECQSNFSGQFPNNTQDIKYSLALNRKKLSAILIRTFPIRKVI